MARLVPLAVLTRDVHERYVTLCTKCNAGVTNTDNSKNIMNRAIITALAGAALATMFSTTAQAVPVTAFELIQDTKSKSGGYDNSAVDLKRERNNGATSVFENDDATIKDWFENRVDNDFGKFNDNNVSYRHLLGWAVPGTITSLSLEIGAYGVNGSNQGAENDWVWVWDHWNDWDQVGTLNLSAGNGLTTFNVSVGYIDNGALYFEIDKSSNDSIEIYSSKLSFTWENGQIPQTPDGGATIALLGMGLIGLGALRRKLS